MSVLPLTAWENFYIIIGSSAGALTGLMFVVITLIAGRRQDETSWAIGAFDTPIVVHLGVVLFLAALLSAPWSALEPVAILLGFTGLGGMAYVAIVMRRMRRRVAYEMVREDWLWFALLPFAGYITLLVASLLLPSSPDAALFIVGAVLLLLVMVGLRNAWDAITFLVTERGPQLRERDEDRVGPD
jgi:hypothetical protein